MADPFNPNDVTNQANLNQVDTNLADWRFRIKLAPSADVLYKSQRPGILEPLRATDGVIFPYTPQIMVNYQANYSQTTPTHSNYKQYFYQGSEISDIQITGTFTAQSTKEADYLQAATHFFRSASKSFYGQDGLKNGTPPPLLFLEGFGDNQFNNQPCVLQQFNYVLPPDVDYVRTNARNGFDYPSERFRGTTRDAGIDLAEERVARNGYRSPLTRLFELFTNGINKGAESNYYGNRQNNLSNDTSYVPTKIEFMLTFHPIVSRKRQSQQFSLDSYANGAGLNGGFW